MMSERDVAASGEGSGQKASSGPKPNLMDRLRALFGLGGVSVREEIREALSDPATSPDFSPQERTILKNVLALRELRVEDVMVPRADIVAVPADTSLAEVLSVFRTAGHSRLPVHGDTLDDPRGMVHIRDFVAYLAARADAAHAAEGTRGGVQPAGEPAAGPAARNFLGFADLDIPLSEADILRPVLFVPPTMPALELLVKMQATHTHMALVIDEYGGTDGLASIEDIMETIVGDIEDEHDFDESPRIDAAADGFVVDARADLEDVSAAIGIDLTAFSDAEDVDTLGGLITTLAGHVPAQGEIIVEDGLEFEVLDADPRRVRRIMIHIGGGVGATPRGQTHESLGSPQVGK
jgi:CBS domain containing-hemolysin-like protein